jgi:hypothetical protein
MTAWPSDRPNRTAAAVGCALWLSQRMTTRSVRRRPCYPPIEQRGNDYSGLDAAMALAEMRNTRRLFSGHAAWGRTPLAATRVDPISVDASHRQTRSLSPERNRGT